MIETLIAILFIAGIAPFAILAFMECQHARSIRRDTQTRSRACIDRCIRVMDVPTK